MRRARLAASLALFFVAAPAWSADQPANQAKAFVTVDSVRVDTYRVYVTGIVQGEAVASTWYTQGVSSSSAPDMGVFAASCQQQALLAMTKPGQYLLTIYFGTAVSLPSSCTITRVAP